MPHWTSCPAVGTEWTEGNEKEGGLVRFKWTWQQDAASQSNFPNCDGPVIGAVVENASVKVYYVNLPQTQRGARQVQINPGYSRTITASQTLAALGLETRTDAMGIIVTPYRDANLTLVVAP
jgi:hypothetical protein